MKYARKSTPVMRDAHIELSLGCQCGLINFNVMLSVMDSDIALTIIQLSRTRYEIHTVATHMYADFLCN